MLPGIQSEVSRKLTNAPRNAVGCSQDAYKYSQKFGQRLPGGLPVLPEKPSEASGRL